MLPTQDFITRINIQRADRGQPVLSPLDPLMLALWDLANPKPGPLFLITGI